MDSDSPEPHSLNTSTCQSVGGGVTSLYNYTDRRCAQVSVDFQFPNGREVPMNDL